jgi:hypothetical protein
MTHEYKTNIFNIFWGKKKVKEQKDVNLITLCLVKESDMYDCCYCHIICCPSKRDFGICICNVIWKENCVNCLKQK